MSTTRRARVLFLTHRLPYAPNRGDRVRAYHLLKLLRREFDVDLVSLVHDDEEASHAGEMESLAATVRTVRVSAVRNKVLAGLRLLGQTPTTHTLLDAPDLTRAVGDVVAAHPPDVVLAYCSGMARLIFQPPLDRLPCVLDMVDVDSAKWAVLARRTRPPKSWIYAREARLLSAFERAAVARSAVTLVVTGAERETLASLAPAGRIEVVGNGVDTETLRPTGPPSEQPVVVFCGVMNYEPNVEAAVWLGTEVWPMVRKARPDARLQIVGSTPHSSVQSLAGPSSGIEVTGAVPDVRPYLWGASVAAAPLLTARGIQNKVLEAIAAGLPVVVTPVVARGLPAEVEPACQVGATAPAFAAALLAALGQTSAERRRRAATADLAGMGWERRLAAVPDLLRQAALLPELPGRMA